VDREHEDRRVSEGKHSRDAGIGEDPRVGEGLGWVQLPPSIMRCGWECSGKEMSTLKMKL
jgi:hypothetical protein